MSSVIESARILIVDDEPINIQLLLAILAGVGYRNVKSTDDARQALPLFVDYNPDLLLLDLNMPHLDGFAVMQQIVARVPVNTYFPILVLTADVSARTKQKALSEGAMDFLAKPFDRIEVLLRIRNLLETRFQHVLLEARVAERTRDLAASQLETLQRLALAAEYRDDDTGQHTRRVGQLSSQIARRLTLPDHTIELVLQAAALHDVGKIGISDTILLKPDRLTPEEFAVMKRHTAIGAKILSGSSSSWLQMAEEIALTHHERWDGGGYSGLQGDQIPILGRIVAVADVFDALTHERPYKKKWLVEDAVAEIRSQSGRQFEPDVVEAFLELAHEEFV